MGTHVFRKGDKVRLDGVVEYASISQAKVNFGDSYTSVFIDIGSINLVTPRFNAGERVVHVGGIEVGYGAGEVIATHEDMVWLKLDTERLLILPACELMLDTQPTCDPETPAAEPPQITPEMPEVAQ